MIIKTNDKAKPRRTNVVVRLRGRGVTLSINISRGSLSRLEALASATGIPRPALIRTAIDKFLNGGFQEDA